jgi:hypothetical protein
MAPWRLALDAAAALALLAALVIVALLDRPQEPLPATSLATAARGTLRLAVTPARYDDMGKLLDSLGKGYRHEQIEMEDLLDAQKLVFKADPRDPGDKDGREKPQPYDVVFLTCGLVPEDWLEGKLRPGKRESAAVGFARAEIVRQINRELRRYVRQGGTLYASDWQLTLVSIAFPEFVDESKRAEGAAQTVRAEVVDAGLRKRLGATIELRFDKDSWQPAAFKESKVNVLIRGTYKTTAGGQATAPLLVEFPLGKGHVVFTSFHNEAQNSQTELELLRSLVFATVTAQLDASVKQTMIQGGFSPVDRNLLSASGKEQAVSKTYECPGGRSLEFVLGFEDRGARLRLTVDGPDGTRLEKEGASTVVLDVPQAATGTWKYTVTPITVPYENFPFTVTVGEK